MAKKFLLTTNNPKAISAYQDHPSIAVEIVDTFLDVLTWTRDFVHRGWHLVTHPQASNLKPKQTPYKSILLAKELASFSAVRDLELIESSIFAYHKFTDGFEKPNWPDKTLEDFQTVDLAVLDSAINRSLLKQLM